MSAPLVVREIPFRDPLAAFAPLAGRPHAVLLDSAGPETLRGTHGRYCIIAADPFRLIQCAAADRRVSVDGRAVDGDPFAVLAAELARFQSPPQDMPVPFGGGAVGFLGYEMGGMLERLPPPKTTMFPLDMSFGLYDAVAAFDLAQRKAWIMGRGGEQARRLEAQLGAEDLPPMPAAPGGAWRAGVSRAQHESNVAAAVDYIRAGDIFQACITQTWTAAMPKVPPFDLYRRLRSLAAAPFSSFLNVGDGLNLMSASPERFLKLDSAGHVESRPIKGTRRRGASPDEDRALADALIHSVKDRAENLMIVDLLRNDLSRVCAAGSVDVPVLCGLETFPAVHHLVSAVTGRLKPGLGAVDLLRASFPGGSVTGAPKIRAMEIIHELEASSRGPYCGAVAWLGFDGAMDSSIVIRTLVSNGDMLTAQAGGGIVAESDPAEEYEESVIKAGPLLRTLTDEPPERVP